MKKKFITAFLLIISIVIILVVLKNIPATPLTNERSIVHDGLERKYLIHLPQNGKADQNLPLVIVLHGGGGDAAGIQMITSFNQVADENNFIVAYPQGTGVDYLGKTFGTWNSGTCCPPAVTNNADDVGFIKNLIQELHRVYSINLKRVYVTGLSNGAQMSYRLACELSDQIAGIAPVSGIAPFSGLSTCQPEKPVPIFHLHGSDDPCVFIAGGSCGGCFAEITNALGLKSEPHLWLCSDLDTYLKTWADLYDLNLENKTTNQTDFLDCVTYNNQNNQPQITRCLIKSNGHTWAGGNYGPACENVDSKICKITKEVLGPLNNKVNNTKLIWDFFQSIK